MRFGFSTIYAWRPHVEHMHYLASLVRQAGHDAKFLSCDGELVHCYTKALHTQRADWMNCLRCRAGGVRSFEAQGVSALMPLPADEGSDVIPAQTWCASSAATLLRFESNQDFASPLFRDTVARHAIAARQMYHAARRWIVREGIEAVCLFNGRIDVTRALLEAAKAEGVPYVTMERTWFGDGIQLYPMENCLGLRSVHRLMSEWCDIPLTHTQAQKAARLVASRFLRRNANEWRAYNVGATHTAWPDVGAKRRVLLVPGSRNEVWGHPDWAIHWSDRTEGFDAVIDHLRLSPGEVVLRCHPNWGEKIGPTAGTLIERHYTQWARARGIPCISSTDSTSTLGLIEQADSIVVCGGSAALEAGALGKQVIAVGPSIYANAGFQSDADSPAAVAMLSLPSDWPPEDRERRAADTARKTLRFAYTMVYRVAQYVDYVRCMTTTRFSYHEGANPDRLLNLLRGHELTADDPMRATDSSGEDEVLEKIHRREWEQLIDCAHIDPNATGNLPMQRRWMFRAVDRIRDLSARGDR